MSEITVSKVGLYTGNPQDVMFVTISAGIPGPDTLSF